MILRKINSLHLNITLLLSGGNENNYGPLSNGERTASPNRLLKWKNRLTIKVEIENDIVVT